MASEFGFRPCKIEDLKGQPKVQKMLQIYIKAAQIKEESFPAYDYYRPVWMRKSPAR